MSSTCRFSLARILAASLVLISFSGWVAAASMAYVGNFKDNTVSVIDLTTNKVVATVPVAAGPHGIAVSPDGRRVYVCGDASSTVSVLDTSTNKVARNIEVGRSPHGDRFTPDGGVLVVAVNGDDQIDFVDSTSQTVVAKTKVEKPHTIAITPNGKLAYVASQAPGNFALVVVDIASHGIVRSIHLDRSPRDLEFGQDGKLYFTETDVDAVEVLDPSSDKIVAEMPTGHSPHIANLFPNAMLGTVVIQGANELGLFDPKVAKVVRHVGVGKQPHWVAVSSSGKMAYVTNEGTNDISVVDIASGRTVQFITVGNSPRKIAIR